MKLADAQAAAPIVAQIAAVQTVLAQINMALLEHWPITTMKFSAPAEGASEPEGTTIDVLPTGKANDENSQLALTTARETYQAQLDALTKQLAAL